MNFNAINESRSKRMESPRENRSRLDKILEKSEQAAEETLPLGSIEEYKDADGNTQPYDIDEAKVSALAASIAESGQLEALIVRKTEDEEYQLLAGHHRLAALKLNKAENAKVKIVDCSDWEAYRIVVESNIRHGLPKPSEIAKILIKYKENSAHEKVTNKMLAEMFDISERQTYRFLKLAKLSPELIEAIDMGLISTNSIDELTDLQSKQQRILARYVSVNEKPMNVSLCKKAITFLKSDLAADVESLAKFLEKKPPKKRYKNEVFNSFLSEKKDLAEKMNEHSEEELSELVIMLLEEYFNDEI